MLFDLLRSLLLFFVVTAGLAWPLTSRLNLAAPERLAATAALSLLGVFLAAWVVYVAALPAALLWTLPLLAVLGLAAGWRSLRELWRDGDVRSLVGSQLLVTGWCVGWLATIVSYSGGGWAGDWFEHWERTRFFLEHGPLDRMFIAIYPLPARPPMANVVLGAFLTLTRVDFAHFQLLCTLLASLAFLPAALLARRFCLRQGAGVPAGGPRAIAVLAVLFLLNPLFVQNATFAWTKLPAAFFVLVALAFFLRAHDDDAPRAAGPLFAACLAAGLLVHYSTGPYAVALAAAWWALGWRRRRDAAWWRATATAAGVGAAVLAMWFGWSLANYGVHGTFLTNTTVTQNETVGGSQLAKIALNLRDTLVPHCLRPMDAALIAQRSPWGWWRDWFFQIYQLNWPLALGSVAWLACLRETVRAARGAAAGTCWFWSGLIGVVTVLGVAAVGTRDHWGLAHVCQQAIVLLGLAWLAARWAVLGRGWKLALVAGATVDFLLGIALHFGVQSYAFDRWFIDGWTLPEALKSYNEPAFMNLAAKFKHHLAFFGDMFAPPPTVVLALLGAILMLALVRARAHANRTA